MFHSIPLKKTIKRNKNFHLYKSCPELIVIEIINDLLNKEMATKEEKGMKDMVYVSFQNILNKNYETMMSIIYSLKQINTKEVKAFSQCFLKEPGRISEHFKGCVDKFYALLELSDAKVLKKFGELMETLPHDKKSAIFLLKLKILLRSNVQKGGVKKGKVVINGSTMLIVDEDDDEYTKIQGTGLVGAISSFFKNTINTDNPGELDDATKNLFRMMHTFYSNNMNMFVIVMSKIMNHLYGSDFKFAQEEGTHGEAVKKAMSDGDNYNKALPFFEKYFEFEQYTHQLDLDGVNYKEDENYLKIILLNPSIATNPTLNHIDMSGGGDYKEKFKQFLFDLQKLKLKAGNSITYSNYQKYQSSNKRLIDDLNKKKSKMDVKDIKDINPAIVAQAKKKKNYYTFLSVKQELLELEDGDYAKFIQKEVEETKKLKDKEEKIKSFNGSTIDYDDIDNANPGKGMSVEVAKKRISSEIAISQKKIKEYNGNGSNQKKITDAALSDLTTFCKKNGIDVEKLGEPDYTEFVKKDLQKLRSELTQLQLQWKTITQQDRPDSDFSDDMIGLIKAEIEKFRLKNLIVDMVVNKTQGAISNAKEKMKSLMEEAKSNFNITAADVTKASQDAASQVITAWRNTNPTLNLNITQSGGNMEEQDIKNFGVLYPPSAKFADTITKFMDKIGTALETSDGFNKLKGLMSADSISSAIDTGSNLMSTSMAMPLLYMNMASGVMNIFGSQAAAQLGTSSVDKDSSKTELISKINAMVDNVGKFKKAISKQIICTEKEIFKTQELSKEFEKLLESVLASVNDDDDNKEENFDDCDIKSASMFGMFSKRGGGLKELQDNERKEVEYLSKLLSNSEKSFQTPGELKIRTLFQLFTMCKKIKADVPAETPLDTLKNTYTEIKNQINALKKYLNENKSKLLAKIDTKTEKDFQMGGGQNGKYAKALVSTIQELLGSNFNFTEVTRDNVLTAINKKLNPEPETESVEGDSEGDSEDDSEGDSEDEPEAPTTASPPVSVTPSSTPLEAVSPVPSSDSSPSAPLEVVSPVPSSDSSPSAPLEVVSPVPSASLENVRAAIQYNNMIRSFRRNMLTNAFSKTNAAIYFTYLQQNNSTLNQNNGQIANKQQNKRIISNNVFMCLNKLTKVYNERTIPDILMYDPDILCFQETPSNSDLNTFNQSLRGYRSYIKFNQNSIYVKNGMHITNTSTIDLGYGRSAIYIRNEEFCVINTHLSHNSEMERISQVDKLIKYIEQNDTLSTYNRMAKLFIVGDMNARYYPSSPQDSLKEESIRQLRVKFNDVFEGHVPEMTHWSGYRIDYIFANKKGRDSVKAAYLIQNANSDHMPLLVDF